MKLAAVAVLCLLASPAMADGPYVGGFVSGGAYGEMGWTGPSSSRKSTMLGGFAGYGFQAGGLIISPEVRVYGGANDQVRMDSKYIDPLTNHTTTDRLTFREPIGASIGANIGMKIGKFTPYVGASLGLSRIKVESLYTPPGFVFSDSYEETDVTQSVRGGLQYDFESYFARAEVEYRRIRRDFGTYYRKTEVSVGLGMRF
ncbi:outer membrane protein [Shinella zoogloeoides]|uniref:outer membrane protein n=1 Tax=Shinella zoogloeoides TaxID=352475 RepID=UPI00299DB61B|nr:outer membrane beta-barrel protein [Shinella zoogloeoides]WPE19974.1 hypothetical protein ShzoTeo12_11540 [Shinella zoogloeoides]